MGFITSEFTRSLATATLGSTLNSNTRAGVMSAPPPMPVRPTANPPVNPASISSTGLALVLWCAVCTATAATACIKSICPGGPAWPASPSPAGASYCAVARSRDPGYRSKRRTRRWAVPRCVSCRAVVPGTARFCPRCGASIGAETSSASASASRPPSPPTATAPPPLPRPPPAPVIPPRPTTNGLAVASLVLSIVWLGGLGSLLAVIFGARARGQVNRSQGTQSGSGLATAGLVIGILGVIGAVITWAAVFTVGNEVRKVVTPATATARVGQAINVEQAGGISNITVVRVEHPVPGRSQFETAGTGKEFAVAEIKLCAGSAGSHEAITMLFLSLVVPDGTTEGPR